MQAQRYTFYFRNKKIDVFVVRNAIGYIVLDGQGKCAFDMTDATVTLLLSGTNTLKSGENRARLQSPAGYRGFVRPAASSSNKPAGEVSPPLQPPAAGVRIPLFGGPPRHAPSAPRHCELQSSEAIQKTEPYTSLQFLDCFASLAMTTATLQPRYVIASRAAAWQSMFYFSWIASDFVLRVTCGVY
jgi:hypothetical protein